MSSKKVVTMVLVFLIVFSSVLSPDAASCSILEPDDCVGPGKHETELYIRPQSGTKEIKDLISAGKAAIWNTREEFMVHLETKEEWKIAEVLIYVGSDPIPVSAGGTPQLGMFPYVKHFSAPVSTYDLVLSLEEDLDFTWGRRDKSDRIQNVSICLKLSNGEQVGKQSAREEAWAYGEKEFDANRGWWMRYALNRPMTGHFIDSPVGGLNYRTHSYKGRTDSSGAFEYFDGETVTLNIGTLELGSTLAQHKISPLDLLGTDNIDDPRVINMARILQSLDADGDPKRGIEITEPVVDCLQMAMDDLNISTLDFEDSELSESLIQKTISLSKSLDDTTLKAVSSGEARDNLEKNIENEMFRKNISKTPEMESAKAKLELMPVYVPARKANGDPVELVYKGANDEVTEIRTEVKPLVSVYADEISGTDGATDVFGAVSLDEGNTWKTTNLSRSADKSSFKLANGDDFPGDVLKPNMKVSGNKILAVWTSHFAKSGKPVYSISTEDDYTYDDPYYEEDIWGVGGPQRSTDYTELGFPEVGELPYHCVWTCRGVISAETGEVTWFKPERLTSGRRDAYQIMVNAANNAAFALVWQEDPEGVRPGEMAGPGHGWSGATTNHKTDVWYSYVKWDDFGKIDENFVSGGDPQHDEDKELTGRPKVLVPFKLPVRISDNDTLNSDSMKLVVGEDGPYKDEEGNWVVDPTLESGKDDKGSDSNQSEVDAADDSTEEDSGNGESGKDDEEKDGSHTYGLEVEGLCDHFYEKINNQGETKWVAVTEDGRLMDGDTGASRPNIMLQPYQKKDGTGNTVYDAYVAIVYEETKGLGAGPPEDAAGDKPEDDSEDDSTILSEDDDSEDDTTTSSGKNAKEDASGEQKGKYAYVPDKGKNIIYHSFTLGDPDLVSGGTIINPQATDAEGNLLYLQEEDGTPILDYDGQPIPAYENARRPRLLIQSKKNARDAVEDGEEATVMVTAFKMGEEGKGRPSDIFMRRWVVVDDENHSSCKGNPYRPENLADECQNISSVTPTDTWENPDSSSEGRDPIKVVRWEQTEENLLDHSYTNEYDDARAHRGFIKGNFLAIAYDWTPNWASARNGNDIYNLYLRRSFDGGATWTTDPEGDGVTHTDTFKVYPDEEEADEEELIELLASDSSGGSGDSDGSGHKEKVTITTDYEPGEFEPARNMSQMTNTKETVIEPRLVGVPGTIMTDGVAKYPEDTQCGNAFWITYGTHSNPGRNSEEEGVPLDLFYSYSTNYGEDLKTVYKTVYSEKSNNYGDTVEVWDWLAKDSGQHQAEQAECQIRMTPDGSVFYAVWNETGDDGSDVMFRRIMRDGSSVEAVPTGTPTVPEESVSAALSTVEISPPLDEGTASTVTLTAVDYDGNSVPDFTFIMDITVNDDSVDRDEIYTIDGTDYNASASNISLSAVTDSNGTASYQVIMPSEIDTGDGISILHRIAADGDPVGVAIDYTNTDSSGGTIVTPTTPDEDDDKPTRRDNSQKDKTNDITLETLKSQLENDSISNVLVTVGSDSEDSVQVDDDVFDALNMKGKSLTIKTGDMSIVIPANSVSRDILGEKNKDPKLKISITKVTGSEYESKLANAVKPDGEAICPIGDGIYNLAVYIVTGSSYTRIYSLKDSIKVSISLQETDISSMDTDILCIYQYNESTGHLDYLGGAYDIKTNSIDFNTETFTSYTLVKFDKTFADIQNHWARTDIEEMVAKHIISGINEDDFSPDADITRAEFTSMLVKALGLKHDGSTLKFTDVLKDKGYYSEISAAAKAGIITGITKDSFCPDAKITREQIVTMILRALNYQCNITLLAETEVNEKLKAFVDESTISSFARLGAAISLDRNIILGRSQKTFAPKENVSRAEAAVIIRRFITNQ